MRKLHFFSILVALVFATTTLWAVPTGALPGMFSVACGEYVYFSQGNLQYNSTSNATQSPRWQFASEQYEFIGNTAGNTNITATGKNNNTGIADLFCWVGASSPFEAGTLQSYGLTSSTSGSDLGTTASEPLKNDWGTLPIFNGGNTANSGWRTLTYAQWEYLLNSNNRSDYRQGNRFAKATVHGVIGLIVLPDGWTQEGSSMTGTLTGINTSNADFTTISVDDWNALESDGAIFLPGGVSYRWGTTVYVNNRCSYYSSTKVGSDPKGLCVENSYVSANQSYGQPCGISVRLVKDVPSELAPAIPQASVVTPPTAIEDLVYIGGGQTLVNAASGVTGGYVRYKLSTQGEGGWNGAPPYVYNAGEYTVQWFVQASNCYLNSDTLEIHVTIDKATFETSPQQPVTPAASWTYDNVTRNLLNTISYAPAGCTIHYSTDGGETWSTTIPQGHDAGTYTVQYKVVRNSNYYDYIPSTNNPFTVVVSKAPYTPSGTYSVEANALTFDNTQQALVSLTGSVTNGTIWYKLGDGEWTTDIPTAKNAGNYSVSYKVVPTNPNYEEYVPAASPIAVTIAKADLPGVTLPEATSTIPYDGTEKTLLNIGAVVGGTVYYSNSSEGPWNTTPRTATDPDDYNVYYKIVPDDTDNYNTIGPNQVVVTISDPYVWVADNENPTSKLEAHLNEEHFDLRVRRIIYADGEYNTICLPFALDATQLAASPLNGFNNLKTIKGAQVSGSGASTNIDIFVEDATAIEAGVPYLISYPSAHADILNPVFEDITVTTTTPGSVSADGVTFQGMFAQVHIDQHSDGNTKDYLFLGENSQLYWPLTSENGNESVKMRGFRAYFIIDRDAIPALVAPRGTHARFVNAPKQPTAIENTELNTQAQKLLENGQLIILKNGIKYNAQGQVLK